MALIIIALAIFLILIIIFFSNITVYIDLTSLKEGVNFKIRLLYLFKFNFKLKLEQEKEIRLNLYTKKIKRTLLSLPIIADMIKNRKDRKKIEAKAKKEFIKQLLKKSKITINNLDITYGASSADKTVYGISLFKIFFGVSLPILSTYSKLTLGSIDFAPEFQRNQFNMILNCIIKLKAGHIIIAYIKYLIKRR